MDDYVYENGALVPVSSVFQPIASGGGVTGWLSDTVGALLTLNNQYQQARINNRLSELQYQAAAWDLAAKQANIQAQPVTTPKPSTGSVAAEWFAKNQMLVIAGALALATLLMLKR